MIIRTGNEDYYNLQLLPKGVAGTLSGISRDNWQQHDALLDLQVDENKDGKYEGRPITPEEARQIRDVLQNVREGKQRVTKSILAEGDDLTEYEKQNPPWLNEVDKDFTTRVVGFLEPRIEVAAESLAEGSKVPLSIADSKLGEKREIDRPSPL